MWECEEGRREGRKEILSWVFEIAARNDKKLRRRTRCERRTVFLCVWEMRSQAEKKTYNAKKSHTKSRNENARKIHRALRSGMPILMLNFAFKTIFKS